MTLATSAPCLAKRIGSWDVVQKVASSIELTEFDMRYLLLVHLFSRSMQGQLDEQATLVRLNHSQGHKWGGRGLQCAAIRMEPS